MTSSQETRRASVRVWNRIAFMAHGIVYGMVLLLLVVAASFTVATVVGISWGAGLAMHGFFAVVAPDLRRKWLHQELQADAAAPALPPHVEVRQARALEELSASIAHEIRNPITAAKSLLQQMKEDPTSADNVEYARVALEELDRVERSVSHLLRFAREEELDLRPTELAEVASWAIDGLDERVKKSPARVERALDFDARMRGDRDKLRRVVMNLVGNALDAHAEGSADDPYVRVSCGKNLAGSSVWLRVKDNGAGIEPARLAKIWSPFFTSKQDGTGLGLAITKKLVEAHGGTIEVTSERGVGTEFVVTFPAPNQLGPAP